MVTSPCRCGYSYQYTEQKLSSIDNITIPKCCGWILKMWQKCRMRWFVIIRSTRTSNKCRYFKIMWTNNGLHSIYDLLLLRRIICGSILVLLVKLHLESITDTYKYIWRVCVSYCLLNNITSTLILPLSHCSESFEEFSDSFDSIYFISLDVRSVYHYSRHIEMIKKSLSSLLPVVQKEFFVVQFWPKNAP